MAFMFKFTKDQKIFNIGGVSIGGQPGQLPTILIGSIFYDGHKIVEDPKKGLFDQKKAEELLVKEEEMSLQTGNPRLVDVNGLWPEAMVRYMDFIAETTESPFLIDCAEAKVGLAALKHVDETGLTDRVIYNSINPSTKPEETSAIREVGLKAAILLAFNKRRPTVEGRIEVLKGSGESEGLLETSEKAGVEKPLVDVAVLDVPDPGPVSKAIFLVKEEFGLPAGGGPHNAIERWRQRRELDPNMLLTGGIIANTMPVTMGANFILYGPIRKAPEVYPACALADAYVAYCMRQQYGITPLTREHPLFKIF